MSFQRDKVLANAARFAARGQHDRAAKEYQSVVENDPKDIRSWLLLADALVRCGRKPEAIERYTRVAQYYAQAGQPQKALAVYRQVLEIEPNRLDLQVRCAGLYRDAGQIQDAINIYERVAQAYLRAGNTREAFAVYKTIAEAEPAAIGKRLRLAELYSREGMVEEAVVEFQRGADQLLAEGQKDQFIRVAERLLYHKKVDEILLDLVRVYIDTDQPRRALMKLNSLLQSQPDDARGLELLAETFVRLGRFDKAVSVVLELVKTLRQHDGSKLNEARRVLGRALAWVPDNPDLRAIVEQIGGVPTVQKDVQSGPVDPLDPGIDSDALALADEPDEAEGVDVDEVAEGEIEELDAGEIEELGDEFLELDDGIDDAGDEVGVPIAQTTPSLTQEVISDLDSSRGAEDGEFDLDKQLEEARVLIKYQLFEHALSHVETVFEEYPEHVAALELLADIHGHLSHFRDMADILVRMAVIDASRDPVAARDHLSRALGAVPDHREARAMATRLGLDPDEAAAAGARMPSEADDEFGEVEVDDSGGIELGAPNLLDEIDTDVLAGQGGHEDIDLETADPGLGGALRDLAEPDEIADDDSTGIVLGAESSGGDFTISFAEDAEDERRPTVGLEVEDRFGLDDDGDGVLLDDDAGEEEDVEDTAIVADLGDDDDGDVAFLDDAGVAEPVEPADTDTIVLDERENESELSPSKTATQMAVPTVEQSFPDLGDELEELEFFLSQGLDDDAKFAFADLSRRHPGHPALRALQAAHARELGAPEPAAETAANPEQVTKGEPAAAASTPTPLFDDDEDDGYLDAIFADDVPKQTKQTKLGARAQVDEADAGTHFDLGTAYREMGLVDDAIAEFEAAAKDARWQARALVMMSSLYVQKGEVDRAIERLRHAIDSARTADERAEANYELAVVYELMDQKAEAIAALEQVDSGYRDAGEKLRALRGA